MSLGIKSPLISMQLTEDPGTWQEPKMNPSVVHLVTAGMITAVVVCLSMIFLSTCSIRNMVFLFAWTLGIGSMMIWTFLRTKEHPPINRYLTLLTLYLFIAYPFKAIISQIPLASEIIPGYFIPSALFGQSLVPAIAYTMGVAAAVGVVMAFPYLATPRSKSLVPRNFNYTFFFYVIFVSLVIKAIAHYILIWGVPNRLPENVIPLVTGMTKMYVTLGIFHLLNVAFVHMSIRGAKMHHKWMFAALTITYLGLDWGIGSKFSTIYCLVMVISTAVLTTRVIKTKARTLILIGLLVLVTITAYPVVHNYRFAKRASPNAPLGNLISRAIEISNEKESSFLAVGGFLKIVQRINGYQNHSSAVAHHNRLKFGYRDLISSTDATSRYTIAVTGIKHEANSYGITQSGLASGLFRLNPIKIFFYSISMNALFALFLLHYTRLTCKPYENWLATGVTCGLFIVFAQFHGGNFLFIGKQMSVLFFAIWLANFFFGRQKVTPLRNANPNFARY